CRDLSPWYPKDLASPTISFWGRIFRITRASDAFSRPDGRFGTDNASAVGYRTVVLGTDVYLSAAAGLLDTERAMLHRSDGSLGWRGIDCHASDSTCSRHGLVHRGSVHQSTKPGCVCRRPLHREWAQEEIFLGGSLAYFRRCHASADVVLRPFVQRSDAR